jgi:phage terminase large subunit-like protein
MADLVAMAKGAEPESSFVYDEFTSDSSHPLDCLHCAKTANPALGHFLDLAGLKSVQRTMRESTFRRVRLGQFGVASDSAYLPAEVYKRTTDTERALIAGEPVILALDGSYSGDSTALVLCSVTTPHFLAVQGLWEPHLENEDYRVPIEAVEDRIREVCKTFHVLEIVCDPYRFQRTIQVLEKDGLPVVEFPQSPERMSPATMNLQEAFFEGLVTHGADEKMRVHFRNSKLRDDGRRGQKIQKDSKMSDRKIDIAVAAIMAHSRATFHATRPQKKGRAIAW